MWLYPVPTGIGLERGGGACNRELPRIPLLGTSVNKKLLVRQLALRGLVGAQPQRDVGGLHGLSHHTYQIVA